MNDQTNQEFDEVIHPNSEITEADILFKRGQNPLKLTEIEDRFNTQIQSAKIELAPPDLTFPHSELPDCQTTEVADVWIRIKNRYEYAQKIGELDAKFGRIQPIVAELKTMVRRFSGSQALKRALAYFYSISDNWDEALRSYQEIAVKSESADDWFDVAALAWKLDIEELSCYSLGKFFTYGDSSIIDEPQAWLIYIDLLERFNNFPAFRELCQMDNIKDAEIEVLLETTIYFLKKTGAEALAAEFMQKRLTEESPVSLLEGASQKLNGQPTEPYRQFLNEQERKPTPVSSPKPLSIPSGKDLYREAEHANQSGDKDIENQREQIDNEGMRHYEEGVRHYYDYYAENNYDMAILSFNEVIKLQPNNAEAYNYRGDSYSRKRSFKAAIIDLNIAIGISSYDHVPYNNRGYAYSRQGEYDLAIKDFDVVIKRFLKGSIPKKAARFAYTCKGFAYFCKGNLELAIENCSRAIELDGSYSTAYNYRGLIHAARKDYNQAINDHTMAIDLKRGYALSYNLRGLAHAANGDYQNALTDYNKAIELRRNKAHAWIYLNRGSAYQEKGKIEQAIADYDSAVRICPKYKEDLKDPNFGHWAQDAVDKAVKLLEDVICWKEKPSIQNIGQSYEISTNSYQGARPFRFQGESVYFQNSEALYYYGVLWLLKNDPTIAWRAFNDALKLGYKPERDVERHLKNLIKADTIFQEDADAYYNKVSSK